MLPFVLGLCIGLASAQSEATSEAKNAPVLRLYGVEDSADAESLWRLENEESLPKGAGLQLLFQKGENGDEAWVLRDGTEAFRLPEEELENWRAWTRNREAQSLGSHPGSDSRITRPPSLWHHLSQVSPGVLDWMLWPTGIQFEVSNTLTSLPKTKPTAERRISFAWSQSFFRYGSAEIGLHRSQFGGGVTRYLRTGEIDFVTGQETPPPYWDDADWWWHAAIGGPVLRFEIRSQGGLVPPFLAFDRDAATLAKRQVSGDVINWFDGEKSHSGNTSQALHLRLGYLRYSLHWDTDAYQAPIMHLGMEGLPFGFGRIQFGLWAAADVFMTEIGMDLMPDPLEIPRPVSWPSTVSITPLHLEFLFRDRRQFQFGLSTRFHFDNRIFRQPGGRP